ncbi:SDR family NAD(P)-dependent oxidoreductase [Actinomadura opuntiae]|uniref:SDR family NAD(P)-dependent oxidoreductase n=1 Tax=Actinomadura sp. OS1-43 TaxID=604315 RepID=UPI00255AA45A|nr:SDR family NAD(P)-dependent oxidoreductase [Actinomadura sp. OS1-43]MDL4817238.1 SDR family NAD(P)-dependent oxidoreductase [Actinomadura sp. OS1-43]
MSVIVMTGATAGLGAHAVQRLTGPGAQVIIGARGSGGAPPTGCRVLPLDLASLDSVRNFADAVRSQVDGAAIDVLVLNAGAQFSRDDRRSADGFEMTFAVNHLAHYLLARSLLSGMASTGRIVFTTSDTHDPAVIPFGPKTLDVRALAHPPRRGSGFRAYAASKLCNLLTARSLSALDEVKERGISVIAFNPGLTGGTALLRGQTRVRRALAPAVLPLAGALLGRSHPQFHVGTPERAGEVLAELALGTAAPPPGRVYASLVKGEITFPDPSELARDDDARDLLWRESAAMVGLPA